MRVLQAVVCLHNLKVMAEQVVIYDACGLIFFCCGCNVIALHNCYLGNLEPGVLHCGMAPLEMLKRLSLCARS